MKKLLGVVGGTLLFAGSALAADLPARPAYKAPPIMAPVVYNWTGFYIGGNVGGVWDTATVTDSLFGFSVSDTKSGFIGGGQIGYNWQVSPQFVLGVEWMFDGTSLSSSFATSDGAGNSFSGNAKVNWLTTVTGRLGYASNNWLFYVKGGGGWVHESASATAVDVNGNVFGAGGSDTNGGWVAGGGIEYGFTPNWTARVDYQHLGLTDQTVNGFADSLTLSRHFDMVTFGLNYKF